MKKVFEKAEVEKVLVTVSDILTISGETEAKEGGSFTLDQDQIINNK